MPADELSKLALIGSLSHELLRLANFSFRHLHTDEVLKIYFANCTYLIVTFVKPTPIPDICHERHEYIRVNFFWPVSIFTDLTRKIGIFDRFYAKKWRFLQI